MKYLLIIGGLVIIFFGFKIMLNPKKSNVSRDKYRIKGKRNYTMFAEGEMVFMGLLCVLAGVFLIVTQILFAV